MLLQAWEPSKLVNNKMKNKNVSDIFIKQKNRPIKWMSIPIKFKCLMSKKYDKYDINFIYSRIHLQIKHHKYLSNR